MPVDHVKDFFGKVEENKSLQEKLRTIEQAAAEDWEKAVDDLVKVASEEGFSFSVQDLMDARTASIPIDAVEGVYDPGIGCQAGMGLYIHIPTPPTPPPVPGPCDGTPYHCHNPMGATP